MRPAPWQEEPDELYANSIDEWGNSTVRINPEVGDDDDRAYLPASKAYELANDDITELRRLPYEQYLRSRHWLTTRRRALLRAGRKCQRCEASYSLEVHHLTYDRLGAEAEGDLMVLCAMCHLREHQNPNRNALAVSRDMARYANVMVEMVASMLRGDSVISRDCQGCGVPVVGENRACTNCGRAWSLQAPNVKALRAAE